MQLTTIKHLRRQSHLCRRSSLQILISPRTPNQALFLDPTNLNHDHPQKPRLKPSKSIPHYPRRSPTLTVPNPRILHRIPLRHQKKKRHPSPPSTPPSPQLTEIPNPRAHDMSTFYKKTVGYTDSAKIAREGPSKPMVFKRKLERRTIWGGDLDLERLLGRRHEGVRVRAISAEKNQKKRVTMNEKN